MRLFLNPSFKLRNKIIMSTINDLLEFFSIDEEFHAEVSSDGGGFKLLGWEELNQVDREDSVYTQQHVDKLLSCINQILTPFLLEEGDEDLLEIEIARCGLCIAIPPVTTEGWVAINSIIKEVLTPEDYQSLDWNLCYADGYTADY